MCAELASTFPHCELSWCQCFHIVSWVGVNVSTLRAELVSIFPHCELSRRQCSHMNSRYSKIFNRNSLYRMLEIWHKSIDTHSAHNVETLTPTQLTMSKHWHLLSSQCGNIDSNSEHHVETLARFQDRVAWDSIIFGLFRENHDQNQNSAYIHMVSWPFCPIYQKIWDHCWVPLSKGLFLYCLTL